MEWAIAIGVVAVLGVAAVVAVGGIGGMDAEPVRDDYRQDLPDRPLAAADVEQLRFRITVRGYAMDQVDDVLARLGREIAERDALIADLTGPDPIEKPDHAGVGEGEK
jgi:DivIVA domain-containing protein